MAELTAPIGTVASRESVEPIIYSDTAIDIAFFVCVFFVAVGVVGNVATIVALMTSKKLRSSPTSVFIVSLCITDLIFCSFNLPLTAVRFANRGWVLGMITCRLFPLFFYLNVAASLFTMCALTINRYVLIAHHQSYNNAYRRRNIVLMLMVCWLFPLLLLLPPLLEIWGRFGYDRETFSCTVLRGDNGRSPKKMFFLIGFLLPCVVILVAYTRILLAVRSNRRAMAKHALSPKSSRRSTDEMAVTRMVIVIFAAFMICYLPLTLANVLDDKETVPDIHVLASVLAWSASVINPFIYGFMSSRYRQAYLSLVPRCCLAGKQRAANNTTNTTTSSHSARNCTVNNSMLMSTLHSQVPTETQH